MELDTMQTAKEIIEGKISKINEVINDLIEKHTSLKDKNAELLASIAELEEKNSEFVKQIGLLSSEDNLSA
jgi:peptidoglycan hydrolase CwlO-like protein